MRSVDDIEAILASVHDPDRLREIARRLMQVARRSSASKRWEVPAGMLTERQVGRMIGVTSSRALRERLDGLTPAETRSAGKGTQRLYREEDVRRFLIEYGLPVYADASDDAVWEAALRRVRE